MNDSPVDCQNRGETEHRSARPNPFGQANKKRTFVYKVRFLNDVCPDGQMMYPAGMMLPSAMMCA